VVSGSVSRNTALCTPGIAEVTTLEEDFAYRVELCFSDASSGICESPLRYLFFQEREVFRTFTQG